jgi:pimeloyl-ACP methyl ester carboxylesterase
MKQNKISQFRQGCLLWTGRLIIGIVGMLLITALAGIVVRANIRAKTPPPGKMVDVGGYRLHLNCLGEGSPTVILEAGQGNMSLIWNLVHNEAAQNTRVCAYDRAGLGWSEPSPVPRSVEVIVQELHTLLHNGNEKGPYIIVGHSLGGLFVRQYAHTFPEEVVGMVLVDSVHEDRFDRSGEKEITYLKQMVKLMPWLYRIQKLVAYTGIPALVPVKGIAHPNVPEGVAEKYLAVLRSHLTYIDGVSNEIRVLEDLYKQVQDANIHSLEDIPLVVLTHGLPAPTMGLSEEETRQSESIWREFQVELSQQSNYGELVVADQSGHDIHLDQPGLVVEAIRKVLEFTLRAGFQ